jgi:hypothetical protein
MLRHRYQSILMLFSLTIFNNCETKFFWQMYKLNQIKTSMSLVILNSNNTILNSFEPVQLQLY